MSYQSEDMNCKRIVTLENNSKCNRFIFDVTLEIAYNTDAEWGDFWHFWKAILTTITCRIGHKYKNWKKCSYVIAEHLYKKIGKLQPSLTEWKGTISVTGQYHDEDPFNNYSEIIYDWFCHDEFMTIPKNSDTEDKYELHPVSLRYAIRFLFNPALPVAENFYTDEGYEKISYHFISNWEIFENIMNTIVCGKKQYNHLEVWQASCDAYKLTADKFAFDDGISD
ncbi:hypothetical protein PV326_007724 [Microctonus aethiopoides]|nr:hypothetical protein PV326_007724 [Microctonus aethiopoides]